MTAVCSQAQHHCATRECQNWKNSQQSLHEHRQRQHCGHPLYASSCFWPIQQREDEPARSSIRLVTPRTYVQARGLCQSSSHNSQLHDQSQLPKSSPRTLYSLRLMISPHLEKSSFPPPQKPQANGQILGRSATCIRSLPLSHSP
jgi:hypothetical protein